MVLPERLVSAATGKARYEVQSGDIGDIALMQRIVQSEDTSYLARVVYKREEMYSIYKLSQSLQSTSVNAKSDIGLRKDYWSSLVSGVRSRNKQRVDQSMFLQPLNRVRFIGKEDLTKPDDTDTICGTQVPVFVYTEPSIKMTLDKSRFKHELRIRRALSADNLKEIKEYLEKMGTSAAAKLLGESAFLETQSRVWTELRLNSEGSKPMANVLLDPEKCNVTWEAQAIKIELTDDGRDAIKNIQDSLKKPRLHVSNLGEPDVAQITLIGGESVSQSFLQNTALAAITIIKDDLGIHTLATYIFRVRAEIFTLIEDAKHKYTSMIASQKVIDVDKIPGSDVQEIDWQAVGHDTPEAWWRTDRVARKVLWLAVRNLWSHQETEQREFICSAVPIGVGSDVNSGHQTFHAASSPA
jgi:hypothetical protein